MNTFKQNSSIRALIDDIKKKRKNRVYYKDVFHVTNLWEAGFVRSDAKSDWDLLVVERNKNETIDYYGFDQEGSYFKLSLGTFSLFPNVDSSNSEMKWRLARVDFKYYDATDGSEYSYSTEQLIDYEERRSLSSGKYESRNVLRIGSLSTEIVEPFGLSRILFSGYLTLKQEGRESLVSAKITISTHPTCDKFDYQYSFDPDYISKIVARESSSDRYKDHLLKLALENRIDQTLMFQGRLEFLGATSRKRDFIMWGAKVRKMLEPYTELTTDLSPNPARESIYFWAECGHSIHLSRPAVNPDLIYGMASSNLDYASYFYDAKFFKKQSEGDEIETSFNQVRSFTDLQQGHRIFVKAFQVKAYNIEVQETSSIKENGLFKISINGFKGWALVDRYNLNSRVKEAQSHLFTLTIGENKLAPNLASESLLGGKGNSLIELSNSISGANSISPNDPSKLAVRLSVPRGIVVTSLAYQIWLKSNPSISVSIDELDSVRRVLSARSVYTNPYSERSVTLAQSQATLKKACEKNNLLLRSCPLPLVLREHLRTVLSKLFSEEDLKEPVDGQQEKGKLFAVRSSAVGEDSLETSAAGQMKTILDASGFDAICNAIVECWASQFEVEAVSYKTQNGMDFNLPMAVVVQELISCQVAGVAATCDPLSGDKGRLEILANVGLGEGVVSGKETDTVRVSLESLDWDETSDTHVGSLSLPEAKKYITKLPNGVEQEVKLVSPDEPQADQVECCLEDPQIVYMANLLLKLRRASEIKDREIEWGITYGEQSSSTSSSSSSDSDNRSFHVHLLQSRPLTHLSRLSSREIDHGLDTGIGSPLDFVTRANLGEVMPGVLCPTNISYFNAILTGQGRTKPFEKNHTRTVFASDTFCFHGMVAAMVLNYTDMTTQFSKEKNGDDQRAVALRTMIGTSEASDEEKAQLELLKAERVNPLSNLFPEGLGHLLALDSGAMVYFLHQANRSAAGVKLDDDLVSLEALIGKLEQSNVKIREVDEIATGEAHTIYDRLCRRIGPLLDAWKNHLRGTILSMAFNVMCMRVLSQQSAYPDDISSSEILNDFSVLIRGGGNTESGDISHLLKVLIDTLVAEGQLERAKGMSHQELFEYLSSSDSKCVQLYRQFMDKNGHRAWKEFDFATLTWAADPSFIMKSLASRLKLYKDQDVALEAEVAKKKSDETKIKIEEILAKLDSGKAILTGYLLPRARNAIVRREQTKSHLIKVIDKYRRAFRYLGGLLCLQGRLPSADLVYHSTFHELNLMVNDRDELPRLIFKARRRQQRRRVLDKTAFPRPVLHLREMIELVKEISEEKPAAKNDRLESLDEQTVSGMTSCAGCVTGRACVVNSLDEMDQVEPNDILVTYSIDISWSVYFYTLSGIVTEVGGIVSHGAVIAREYGIPTLCSAVGACSKFRHGQLITLDANNGVCYAAEAET